MTFFDKYCIDKKCYSCCNNNKCEEHFLLCKCKKRKIKKDLCRTNSCCGKCCTDSHCDHHFDTGHEMTNKDLMYCKVILGSKGILPAELINIIVDEYIDNRLKCYICDYKFLDLENEISYGSARVCYICNNWICENCYSTSLIYGTIETFCDFCQYDIESDDTDLESFESDLESFESDLESFESD